MGDRSVINFGRDPSKSQCNTRNMSCNKPSSFYRPLRYEVLTTVCTCCPQPVFTVHRELSTHRVENAPVSHTTSISVLARIHNQNRQRCLNYRNIFQSCHLVLSPVVSHHLLHVYLLNNSGGFQVVRRQYKAYAHELPCPAPATNTTYDPCRIK